MPDLGSAPPIAEKLWLCAQWLTSLVLRFQLVTARADLGLTGTTLRTLEIDVFNSTRAVGELSP